MWLDAANCADYLYIFLIGINVIFSKKNGKIYQIYNKILESLYYVSPGHTYRFIMSGICY